MKILLVSLYLGFMMIPGPLTWLTDFNQAKTEAATKHKLVLISFSGSDWCGPCIRTRKEIFDTETFQTYADENLVLVQADFPRAKKNQLSKEQIRKNELLADQYNKEGLFPLTLLVNEKGKVLKQWEGFPKESPSDFVKEIKAFERIHN